ncbi:hypothetical protein ABLE68_13625 [Nocardioides sp. CN2-186]|uniref:hypothetical protein n=1 Tax=Nocardioides tweenelious TaxID=3156607 RepID=UPI0032B5DF79
MAERTMNARQMEVLGWLVAGCPDGVMIGVSHKTTAVALQNRRLATVSKRKGVWKAEPTDAGRYFVEHGEYPAGHWSATAESAFVPFTPATHTRPTREPKVTGLRPADQLMADLAAGGGEIKIPANEIGYWENLILSATRHKKVPDGKRLKIAMGADRYERLIRLEHRPDWMTVELDPIQVADALRGPHPAVVALRDDKQRLQMKRGVRARALRILDAIAQAAAARGYAVAAPKAEQGYRHAKGHLVITIGKHPNTIVMDELNDRVSHEPTRQELERKARYSWSTIPKYDYLPSGRLRIKLDRGWHVRQESFSDTKTINLEDRLPHVLQELELRAAADEARERERELERDARKRQWEQIHDEAVVQAREHHRAGVLLAQVEGWHEAHRLDAYLNAMEARVTRLGSGDRKAAEEWMAWAQNYRQRIDPLSRELCLPPDPQFSAEVIAPFMRGLSPYGPPAG